MHGNVWEWCRDVYANKLPGGIDPEVSAAGPYRVTRSGSWDTLAVHCRAASVAGTRRNSGTTPWASAWPPLHQSNRAIASGK